MDLKIRNINVVLVPSQEIVASVQYLFFYKNGIFHDASLEKIDSLTFRKKTNRPLYILRAFLKYEDAEVVRAVPRIMNSDQ